MLLKKAIEILNHIQIPLRTAEDHDRFDALKLGIEALKRIQKLRGYSMTQVDTRLPGETGD